jgi:Na+-transporting NADH:ubiquinone oxidoreductase subunit NqrA
MMPWVAMLSRGLQPMLLVLKHQMAISFADSLPARAIIAPVYGAVQRLKAGEKRLLRVMVIPVSCYSNYCLHSLCPDLMVT